MIKNINLSYHFTKYLSCQRRAKKCELYTITVLCRCILSHTLNLRTPIILLTCKTTDSFNNLFITLEESHKPVSSSLTQLTSHTSNPPPPPPHIHTCTQRHTHTKFNVMFHAAATTCGGCEVVGWCWVGDPINYDLILKLSPRPMSSITRKQVNA